MRRLHAGRRGGARRDELRRRRPQAQHDLLVSRASVQRRRRLGVLQHGHGEDAAQLSDPIREAAGHVIPEVWSPLSDEALLAGFGARDPDASAAFVRRFQSRVFGLALTILGDRGEAEEAAQEAFLRAWRHAEAYDPRRGAVATWLLAIARNVAIDRARMRRSEPVDPSEALAEAIDPARSPEERRIAGEEAERL